MFGFGKKKNSEAEAPAAADGVVAAPVASAPIAEDAFVVMPEQYVSTIGSAGRGLEKSTYWLMGGALLFLLALSGGLYFFFFRTPSAAPIVTPLPIQNQPVATTTPAVANTPRLVSTQAYGPTNELMGALTMTVPPLVANKYGEAMGITVLSQQDITLPAASIIVGGLYSLYPVGITFDSPITLELSATALPTLESRTDFYPAWLKGVAWEEANPAQLTSAGWSLTLDKFVSGPLSIVRRVSTAATTTPPLAGGTKPTPSTDSDTDGLTDKEELLIGSDTQKIDTDGDTYPDKSEFLNGYSPLLAKEKIDPQLFTVYTNPTYGYKVSYPTKWLADALDQSNKQILFISDTEEFFEILVEDNPLKQPIVDWYRSQSPSLAGVQLDVTVFNGQAAVWSPDGLTLYMGKDGLIYIITYNKGTLDTINWPSLFEYFYKGFKFGNTGTGTTTAAMLTP